MKVGEYDIPALPDVKDGGYCKGDGEENRGSLVRGVDEEAPGDCEGVSVSRNPTGKEYYLGLLQPF